MLGGNEQRMSQLIKEKRLRKLYLEKQLPMHEIAKQLKVSVGSVYKYCKIYGIETRDQKSTFTMQGRKKTKAQCKKNSEIHKGKILSSETRKKMSIAKKKGGIGHKKKRCDGYISIYFPDHPNSNKDGYIFEHVLVMECFIGRHLKNDEVVHHINHKRDDNRKENLKLMTKSEHMSFHAKERAKKGGMAYQ